MLPIRHRQWLRPSQWHPFMILTVVEKARLPTVNPVMPRAKIIFTIEINCSPQKQQIPFIANTAVISFIVTSPLFAYDVGRGATLGFDSHWLRIGPRYKNIPR